MLSNDVISFVSQTKAAICVYLDDSNSFIKVYSDYTNNVLSIPSSDTLPFLSFLSFFVEDKKKKIIFYDCKNLYSLGFKQSRELSLEDDFYSIDLNLCQDLCYREKFCGINLDYPKSIKEIVIRFKSLTELSKKINTSIHLPLATQVVPDIENTPLINSETGSLVYPYYEIEGQANGRMGANGKGGFNPHILSDEELKKLYHKNYDHSFIVCDYNALELRVLAHISKDENLIADTNEKDPYLACWKRLFPDDVIGDNTRNTAKSLFLPHFFGKSHYAMAKDLGVSETSGKMIFDTINTNYSKAASCLLESDEKAKNATWIDCIGRKRTFEFSYQARNAEIQGPAAIFCQEHLIKLHQSINNIGKIHASIHDGFIISCKKEMSEEVSDIAHYTLVSPSNILEGLSVPVSIRKGQTLSNLF